MYYSKVSNGERIMKIVRLGAELQLYVYHDVSTIRNSKWIVVSFRSIPMRRRGSKRKCIPIAYVMQKGERVQIV